MLPVSHTYVSLYATPDNETHFRIVPIQFDLVENFAIPAWPLYIGGTLPSRRAFCSLFRLTGANQNLPQGIWHQTPARQLATVNRGSYCQLCQ